MKKLRKWLTAALALAMLLSLAACAKKAEETPPPEDMTEPDSYTVAFVPEVSEAVTEDGDPLMKYSYDIPVMTASGSEEAQAKAAAFNTYFQTVKDEFVANGESLKTAAQEDYRTAAEDGRDFYGYTDEMICEPAYRAGDLVSITGMCSSYTGGAHPNSAYLTWNFDCGDGTFFSWEDIAGDEEVMRSALAADILRQIEQLQLDEGYFEDYEESVRTLDGVQVGFAEDGMTVYFSDYQLGPHAAGIPTFTIAYSVFAKYLNARGKALLGK